MGNTFDIGEIRRLIKETLKEVSLYSKEAVDLLLYTAMTETGFKHLVQGYSSRGTAASYFQVEPATAIDHYRNYLLYRIGLRLKIKKACKFVDYSVVSQKDKEDIKLKINKSNVRRQLIYNIRFSIIMARLVYYRDDRPIPETTKGKADMWKNVYNTNNGKGEVEDFLKAAEKCKEQL